MSVVLLDRTLNAPTEKAVQRDYGIEVPVTVPATLGEVTGYRVYYGKTSGVYELGYKAVSNGSAVFGNLTAGTNYYFMAVSVSSDGEEGPHSPQDTQQAGSASRTPRSAKHLLLQL